MTPSRNAVNSPSVKRMVVAQPGQVRVCSLQASSRPYILIARHFGHSTINSATPRPALTSREKPPWRFCSLESLASIQQDYPKIDAMVDPEVPDRASSSTRGPALTTGADTATLPHAVDYQRHQQGGDEGLTECAQRRLTEDIRT